jgi:Protein of unknown function (DUF2726)
MNDSVTLVSVILIVVMVLKFLTYLLGRNKAAKQKNSPMPYKMKNLMTPTELILFTRLVAAFPDYFIMSQVHMGQILNIPKGLDDHKSWLNKINQLSLDFVICDKESKPLCVIELDDASHLAKSRIVTDTKKDLSLQAAGIRIVRIKVSEIPAVSELTKLISI